MDERVGNAQRTLVLDLLSKALEEGYVDLAEYEQRMIAVAAAKTVPDLTRQLADLPRQYQWDPRHYYLPAAQTTGYVQSEPSGVVGNSSAHSTAVAALVLGIVSLPMTLCLGAGLAFGIAAIFLSRPGLRMPAEHGRAVTGLVLGCIGSVLSVGFIAIGLLGNLFT